MRRRGKLKNELLSACRRTLAAHKFRAPAFRILVGAECAGKLVRPGAYVVVSGGSRGWGSQ